MVEEVLTFAQETAVFAGKLTQQKWLSPLTISEKGRHDLVTDADIAAQALVTQAIKERFPSHGFLTEEDDDSLAEDGDIIWIIDPIDGTTNYSRLQPLYCVSIGAAVPLKNEWGHVIDYDVQAGVIYDPSRDELFSAGKGLGAWVNGRLLQTSPLNTIDDAIIGVDFGRNPHSQHSAKDFVLDLSQHIQGIRLLGSAALALAWVAAGRFDAYINFNLKPWDIAAGLLLINEAGGTVSDSDGTSLKWEADGMDCLASNGRIHSTLAHKINSTLTN